MAKKKKAVEELDDFEVLEEVVEDEDTAEDDSGNLSAKEAAKLIGTDARTLRKFLRKKAGKVGQGNRWLIDPAEIDDLKAEFEAAQRPKADSDDEPKPKTKKAKKTKTAPPPSDEEIYGSDDDDDEIEEPTDDEIFDLEDELDFEELEEI